MRSRRKKPVKAFQSLNLHKEQLKLIKYIISNDWLFEKLRNELKITKEIKKKVKLINWNFLKYLNL